MKIEIHSYHINWIPYRWRKDKRAYRKKPKPFTLNRIRHIMRMAQNHKYPRRPYKVVALRFPYDYPIEVDKET